MTRETEGFPESSVGKRSACNAGVPSPVPGEDHLEKEQATHSSIRGFPCGSAGKGSASSVEDVGSIPGLKRFPWRRERLPTPVCWPEEFHELYNPSGQRESDMAK